MDGRWSEADQQALIGGSLPRTVAYLLERATRPAAEDVGRWLVDGMTSLLMSRKLRVLPGARELLAEVRAAGIALRAGHILGAPDHGRRDCGRLEITFSATVCADDVTRGKPDPEPYLRAASLLGADPRCCVALEDSPNGVASAEAAGCRTVAVPSLVPIEARPGRVIA